MEKQQTACFTGHRGLGTDILPEVEGKTDSAILDCVSLGVTKFECGGALGFDTLAAQRVLAARKKNGNIILKLVLPCRDQCVRWSTAEIRTYKKILANADEVEYISEFYHDGCMAERNRRLVDDSSVCICCYDGGFRGGTAQTVRYAQKTGLRIINVMPAL